MSLWYQGTVRYQLTDEQGRAKNISETYLVNAVSYTEAEARVYDVAAHLPDFNLSRLSRMRLSEVFFVEDGSPTWFKVKVQYISFDEKSQKEKKVPYFMLINALNPRDAYDLMVERLGAIQDYIITDITITNIIEVVPYDKEENPLKNGNFKPLAEVKAAQEVE